MLIRTIIQPGYMCNNIITVIIQAIPKFTISGSAVAQDKNILKGEDVYIHKKLGKKVPAGTTILYCKYSKLY